MKKEKTFILGASGFIGKNLFNFLKEKKMNVVGTYNKNKHKDLIFFDIAKSSVEKLPLEDIKYGILCSGVAKIDECKKKLGYSNKINVVNLEKIIEKFLDKSIIPVFISSESVFDGVRGGYEEASIRNPKSVYGEQKKQIEDFIISNSKEYFIIRLGKIFGTKKEDGGIFFDWIEKYRKGEKIICASNQNLSLTYVMDVAKGIAKLLEKNKFGIFHIDSGIHKSRLEFAEDFFKYLKINDAKIEKCSLEDFHFVDVRAKNAYLNSSKFKKEFNFKFTPLEECYKIIKTQI
jgi:dTDP-4-dehydrorhamnose reductase